MKGLRILTLTACLLPMPLLAQSGEEDDRGYLQGLIEDAFSGAGREVRIEGFEGALSSSATLGSLTIADADGVWLTMTNAQLDWRRAALLRGRLEVDTLSAETLSVTRLPTAEDTEETGFALPDLPPPQATAFSLPELPVSIQIGQVSIATVDLGEDVIGQATELSLTGSAALEGGEGQVDLTIARTDGTRGAFGLMGSYANSTDLLSVSLSVSEDADGLVATLMDVPDRPSLDLTVSGEGSLSDFAADIALRTDAVDRLSGRVAFGSTQTETGTTEQFYAADLNGDIRPLLKPDYRSFFGAQLTLDVDAVRSDEGGLDISTLALQSAALSLNGQISLGPESWPQRIALRGRIAPVEGDSVLLSIPGPPTRLDQLNVDFAYDAAMGDRWNLALQADALTRESFVMDTLRLSGRGTIAAGEGEAVGRVLGDLALNIAGLDLGDADLNRAVGSDVFAALDFALIEDEPFRLQDMTIRGDSYALTGDIALSLPEDSQSPVVETDLTLAASDIARFAPLAGQPIGGAVQVDVDGQVTPLDGAFDIRVAGASTDLSVGIAQVDPLIAGDGILSLSARRDAVGTFLDGLDLRTPQARIRGDVGITGEGSSAQVTARILDAALIHPDMAGDGEIAVDFDQRGTRLNADVTARAPGQTALDLRLRTPDGEDQSTYTLDLSSEDVSVYAWAVDRPLAGAVTLSAQGQADLAALAGTVQMDGTATGLQTGVAEADALLDGAVRFVLNATRDAAGAIALEALDVTAPRIMAEASGTVLGSNSRLAYTVEMPNFGVLVAALPGPLAARGTVGSGGQDWNIASDITGPAGMQVAVNGRVATDASRADLTVTGAAPLALANRQLAPNIVEGLLRFDLGLQGPLEVGSVSGTLSTSGATLSLPAQKLAFSNIDSTVGLAGGQANVDATLTASTGGGLRVSGPVQLAAPFSGNLSVQIEDLGVVEPGLLETAADGQLTVSGPLKGGARIAGQITFDEVGIQVPSTSGAASAALPGLVHRGEPTAVRQSRGRAGLIETQATAGGTAPPFGLDVLVSAPSRIFIRGRGLDAEMGGALRISGTTNQVIPTGRFELIRGRLNILGQRLDLTEGYIEPQGDLDPFMRIVAEATAGSTDVRFVIEGQVSSPDLIMTSSPELPEDEILSRFLFGRDLTEISTLQALQIADAIRQLSGRGPGAIGSVREGLGLDDLDVSTTETGETTVRAGKYISENIYSDVSRTTDGETEINLNLTITPSLTARGTARSDSSTSLGIFLEKDY